MSIPKKIEKQVTELLSSINQNLPQDMELELEGYYDRGFFVTKKRYAVICDGVITVKGLELVRRDWATVAKNTQHEVLEAILKQIAPHVIAAEKLELHGQTVTSGSIIRYIITKGKEPISRRAEPIEYIGNKTYDPEYYIQNQVLPATLRILEAIGYTEEQIMNNEIQTSLDSFF